MPLPEALDTVLADELAHLQHHRHPHQSAETVGRNLVGIALSGGGIRSATTNLGVLQALSRMDVLPLVDYISTVSGGGYIGAALSSLLSINAARVPPAPVGGVPPSAPLLDPGGPTPCPEDAVFNPGDRPRFSTLWENFPFRTTRTDPGGRLGTELVAHLRTHGNFLIARKGMLRRETMRGIGNLITGIGYNVILFLLTLFACAAIYMTAALAVIPSLPDALGRPDTTFVIPDSVSHRLIDGDRTITQTRVIPCTANDVTCRIEHRIAQAEPTLVQRIGQNVRVPVAVFATAWHGWITGTVPPGMSSMFGVPLPLWLVLVAAGGGAIIVILAFMWLSVARRRYLKGQAAAPIAAARGESDEDVFERRVLKYLAGFLGLSVVVILVVLIRRYDAMLLTPAEHTVWLFAPLAVLLGMHLCAAVIAVLILPARTRWTRRMRSVWGALQAMTIYGWWMMLILAALPFVMYAVRDQQLGVAISGIGSIILTRLLTSRNASELVERFAVSAVVKRVLLAFAVAAVVACALVLFGAFLAGRPNTWNFTFLSAIVSTVLLLVLGRCVNHNKLGPHYFYRDRLAETYLLSEIKDDQHRLRVFRDAMEMPLHCLHGQSCAPAPVQTPVTDPAVTPPVTNTWRNSAPYHLISAAINLAGSRDLTRKDRKSGYWLFSKLYCGSRHTGYQHSHQYRSGDTKVGRAVAISGAAASSAMGSFTFFAQAFATVLFNIRLGYWVENPAREESATGHEVGVFWPSYLWREVTMGTTENEALVNLSDGGHTGDNIGIYPLLERRCKIIIACDAECDGKLTFGSFTEALRQAHIDMGIDVDIDLTMLRPDPHTGMCRSHSAVGRIRYPDRPDQVSYLIYLKNSLTGDEPEPVLNYKSQSETFPHESTSDQFFDDTQFESYRTLGVHLAEHAFAEWITTDAFRDVRAHHWPV
jgi:hypothetical protein